MEYRINSAASQNPIGFSLFYKEVRDQIDISLRSFVEKTVVSFQKIEPLLLAQIETEILPFFESSLVESIGTEGFHEFKSYGEELLQSTSQLKAKSIVQPEFFEMLRGSVSKRYKPLRNQVISWLCLKAFVAGRYWPSSNLNILTWAKAERRALKIPVRISCPICSGGSTLFLHSLGSFCELNAEFCCSHCGHCFHTPNDGISRLNNAEASRKKELCCACDFCTKCKAEVLETVRREIIATKDKRLMEYKAWRIGLPKPSISRQTMFRDHQLNKNNAGKDLRLILSLKPQTGDDFMSCIEAYQTNSRDAVGRIVAEAIRNRVIYETFSYHAHDYESFEWLLADSIAVPVADILWPERLHRHKTYYHNRTRTDMDPLIEAKRQAFEKIILPLLNDPAAHLNFRVLPPHIYFSFDSHWILLHGPDIRCSSEANSDSKKTRCHPSVLNAQIYADALRRITLNAAFLECAAQHKPTGNSGHRRLFNSDIERNAYQRWATHLEDIEYIVIPNRVFYQLLTREALRDLEGRYYRERPADWQYVRTCELDLTIYDCDGHLISVEEVQRGDHHNQTEWIHKDALKREALGLAGIPFTESF